MKKDFSRKIVLTNEKEGLERRKELLSEITEGGTYLPKAIDYSDIDKSTIEFITNDLDIVVGGEKVPVFFMSIQKWTEFTRSWGKSDNFKDVEMPFITIVRDPDIQPGNNQDGIYDVASYPTFSYHKVPTFNNGREGYDMYKIPQPTSSDLTYHVKFFTNRMEELNRMQNKIQRTFKARQYYVNVLGHPMPILLEGIVDDSRIDDVEARRYYAINFEMVVNGYILNDDDFEITPWVDRSLLIMEGSTDTILQPKVKRNVISSTELNFDINYKNKSTNVATIKLNINTQITSITNIFNVKDDLVIFKVNGLVSELGQLNLLRGDILEVIIERDNKGSSAIILNGTYTNNNN